MDFFKKCSSCNLIIVAVCLLCLLFYSYSNFQYTTANTFNHHVSVLSDFKGTPSCEKRNVYLKGFLPYTMSVGGHEYAVDLPLKLELFAPLCAVGVYPTIENVEIQLASEVLKFQEDVEATLLDNTYVSESASYARSVVVKELTTRIKAEQPDIKKTLADEYARRAADARRRAAEAATINSTMAFMLVINR